MRLKKKKKKNVRLLIAPLSTLLVFSEFPRYLGVTVASHDERHIRSYVLTAVEFQLD